MKKNHFKRLITLLTLCCTCVLCYSTIAYPNLVNFQQPNGNIVKVIMRGSEALKWAESEDGYTLMYDSIGNLVYAELDAAGDLVPSGVIAVDKEHRPVEVEQRLKSTPKQLTYSKRQIDMVEQIQNARNKQMSAAINSGAPVVGTKKMLLILVEFPDYPFKKSKKDFELLMNQLNYTDDGRYGSVRDFYLENSFGQLDLITDVVGVYRLKYDRAYYGGNNGYSNDNDPRQMALEAITMANADVDFSKYDNDRNGIVDGVHIIYAGPGEEAGGGSDCIWAHSWSASTVVDGVRTNRYSCSPEIRGSGGNNITHIGVICHEIGHVLGAMDFYDTNYGTGGQYPGTGMWDLMASGNWNGDGACPAHFNPYSKIYDYGWATVADGNKAASFTLGAKSQNSFVRIDTQTDGEFFLLEYRAKSGFDTCIPYHGLMIYRASDGLSRMSENTLNAYHKQQFYPLVANATSELPTSIATTYGSVNTSTAPFPGALGIDEITDFTTPSMKSWIGVSTEFPITSIKENVSDESVTFDVAGGEEGGAYSFKVTDSDIASITFSWKTPVNEKVVLAYNNEPTFGVPENRNYTVGETINGGGEVIYVGNGTTFKHNGLEQQEEYYYKLFTLRADGTYTAGRQLKAETATNVIRKFPYTEDFSSMQLPTTWKNELIIGEEPWKVDQLYETGNWMLIYEASFTPHRKTRLIMPVVDFTNVTCAALSFDYRNFLQILEVAYRTSPTDEWHILESFEAKEAISNQKTIDGKLNANYKLPNLSSNYEISFTVDYKSIGNSISSSERATIDNITIQTDFNAFVTTLRPNFISSTSAKIETKAFEGTEKITEKGIQWSTNNSSWTTVKAEADGVAKLSSLPKGSTIYYRGYAKIESGKTLYGETQSFTTLTFSTGSGTKEDPYLIGSNADWTLLRNVVNAGNECENIHFAINKSFTLTNSTKINNTFNGIIDGRNNTVTITSQKINSLFDIIGPIGKLMNISIHIDKINAGENLNSGVYCSKNSGQISYCKTYIGELNSSGYCFGICRSNEGTIYNCESEMYGKGDALNAAGICWFNNTGTIIGCSFKGKLSANNNGDIAGIAACNYTGKKNSKESCGLISDCVNYGTMEIYLNSEGKAWWVGAGGICSSNYGWIQRCVNKGTIIANNGDNSVNSGGIVSSNERGTIIDCYNLGEITTSNNSTSAQAVGVGGVAGSGYLSSIRNAFSLKNIKVNGVRTNYINGIIGSNNQTEIENCYYWGEDTDGYATQCEYFELCSQDMMHELNNNGENDVWTLMDGRPALKWEKTGVMMTQDLIFGMDATSVDLSWIVLGKNVVSSGLEWRKRGTLTWKRESGACNQPSSVELSGLEPATIYETRVYAITTSGETLTTPIETFATLFESDGTKNDPHLITNYNQLLAFNEMVAHGVELGGEIVRLTCDLHLKGEQGILWNPIKSKYGESSFEGEFDGNGHVLSHMYIDTKKCYAGLFGLFRGYVHDLTIVNSDIKCNTAPTTNGYYAGVGGIVGSSVWYSTEYPHIVQRCGFEGRITGGNAIGGIIGAVASIDAVNDCYANADITYTQEITSYSSQTGVGGIVGKGNALNSYATGSITINNTFGVSYGPIAGRYYNASSPNVNSYYNLVCNKSYSNSSADIKTATGTMQSDAFLNSLTADVWTRANHINEGYPIFASRAVSRVTTGDVEYTEYGDIEINGIYTMGVDKEYNTFGFQWYSKMGDKQNIIETIVENNSKNCFSLVIPNNIVTNEGINYRAFAIHDNDTILGEWTVFIPTISVPQLTINEIVVIDKNSAKLKYNIVADSTNVIYKFEYAGIYEPDSIISVSIDAMNTQQNISGIKRMQEYRGNIIATIGNKSFNSAPITWVQKTENAHSLTYILDDSIVAVHYYEYGDSIEPLIVTELMGIKFMGWNELPKTMPDKDVIVKEQYLKQFITFKDPIVEQLCLANWDTNNDGLLSKGEARNVTNIGDVFKNNKSIKSFDELEYFTGLTFLNNTFYNCTSLESVHLPNSLTTIEDRTFYGCSGLRSIEIPTNITTIGYYAFYGCSGLTAVHINDLSAWCKMNLSSYSNPLHYAHNLYINGEKLTKLVIPEDVININNEVFNGCSNLTSVELGKNVKSIGKYTFQFCTGLTSITIPENVKSIGSGAFEECNALTNITINNSTTIINNFAFYKCPQIANIYLLCENPPKVYSNSFSYYTATLYVPQGAKATYAATDTWKNFNNIKEISSNKYFCITYMVDGEIYATDSIASGSTITLIDEPTKEGYTFSGWSEAPETMPDEDIIINGTFTVNYYKVTYTVDGKIYATDNIAYGSKITLINIPAKDGYTFSGWSEAPETMPAKDITISGTFTLSVIPGDANMDRYISMADVVAIVSHILHQPTKEFNATAADITGDGNISMADIVGIVNVILNPVATSDNDYNAKRSAVTSNGDRMSISGVSSEGSNVSIPVSLENTIPYTAFQMDVELPEDATLASATLGSRATSSHSVTWSNIGDNKVRVVAYSLNNAAFKGATGELVTLNVETAGDATGTVSVDNVRMVTAAGVENAISGCGSVIDINGTTGISTVDGATIKVYSADGALVVESDKDIQLSVYTVNGRLVKVLNVVTGKNVYEALPAGVYVANGVKVIIK